MIGLTLKQATNKVVRDLHGKGYKSVEVVVSRAYTTHPDSDYLIIVKCDDKYPSKVQVFPNGGWRTVKAIPCSVDAIRQAASNLYQ